MRIDMCYTRLTSKAFMAFICSILKCFVEVVVAPRVNLLPVWIPYLDRARGKLEKSLARLLLPMFSIQLLPEGSCGRVVRISFRDGGRNNVKQLSWYQGVEALVRIRTVSKLKRWATSAVLGLSIKYRV